MAQERDSRDYLGWYGYRPKPEIQNKYSLTAHVIVQNVFCEKCEHSWNDILALSCADGMDPDKCSLEGRHVFKARAHSF